MSVELDPLLWDKLPTKVADLPEGALWECQVFGTWYRGLVLRLPVAAERVFGLGAQALVAVEPAGGKKHLVPARMWATFVLGKDELYQSYVEEKLAVQGEDAIALTVLVAAMLDRKPYLTPEEEADAVGAVVTNNEAWPALVEGVGPDGRPASEVVQPGSVGSVWFTRVIAVRSVPEEATRPCPASE